MNRKNKVRIVFYLEEEHKEYIKSKCNLLGIKPSFFIRNAVLEKLGKKTFVPTIITSHIDTIKYIGQLLKIGNNLNQIAKKLNSNNKFLIADQQAVLRDIEYLKKHIIEINSKL